MRIILNSNKNKRPELISYRYLRRVIGILGVLFPTILWLGCLLFGYGTEPQSSISAYYGTQMRNVFVGFLFAIGLFMFSYKGYGGADSFFGTAACLFALLVAFCPFSSPDPLVRSMHFISAALFFLVLAIFSLSLFTTKDDNPSANKLKRNRIYRICGIIILTALSLLLLYFVIPSLSNSWISKIKPVFVLESIALWAFGFSWLTKGGLFYPDPKS